jgi:hypothetical protein
MGVTLEDIPKTPTELEDFVAALFQSSGYFVEKNITERAFTEILELDAVATNYDGVVPELTLAEAKSGDWGFSDVFKVVGWMQYLGIPKGALFVSKDIPNKNPSAVQQKVAHLGVSIVHFGNFSDPIGTFTNAGFPPVKNELAFHMCRFSYWVERRLIEKLRDSAKNSGRVGPGAALDLHRLINDKIFFVKDVRQQLNDLYDAYKQHPHVALGMAQEMAGGTYDPTVQGVQNQYLKDAMFNAQHEELQAAFYIEQRARLSILKCAVDYTKLSAAGKFPPAPVGQIDWNSLLFSILPASFHAGLNQLSTAQTFHRYALFWQMFLLCFGGFYLKDKEQEEFEWMSQITGVPAKEIPFALTAFEKLFPHPWLASSGPTQCVVCKLVPAPIRGIGAFHRLRHYGVDDYEKIGNYSDYTASDLAKWHNAGVKLLTP